MTCFKDRDIQCFEDCPRCARNTYLREDDDEREYDDQDEDEVED